MRELPGVDVVHHVDLNARLVGMGDVLRHGHDYDPSVAMIGQFENFWALQAAPFEAKRLLLEAGINTPTAVAAPDGIRTPVIALRSSPWRAGDDVTPWHYEFDLDHGHIRYFGDHKADTLGPVGRTRGNAQLLKAWHLHASGDRAERLLAPPLLVFRGTPVVVNRRRVDKGHVEFCGAAIMERLEYVVMRDPRTGRTFPNIASSLTISSLISVGSTTAATNACSSRRRFATLPRTGDYGLTGAA